MDSDESGLPALEELLKEFKDVFPEDLPAESPPEREITMRIPIKPGSKPPHQPLTGYPLGQMPPSGRPLSTWRSMGWSTQVTVSMLPL